MIESTRRAWILASSEILEELQKGWSQPVQVRASENPDGSWDMTVRTCSGLQEVAELARLLNRDDETARRTARNRAAPLNP